MGLAIGVGCMNRPALAWNVWDSTPSSLCNTYMDQFAIQKCANLFGQHPAWENCIAEIDFLLEEAGTMYSDDCRQGMTEVFTSLTSQQQELLNQIKSHCCADIV